jgi:hypothetical protein
MSGWSMSRQTIFAARRVVPPDLIAPAARSPIFSQLISPLDLPPPDSGSFSARRLLKFVPVPEPYLKRRASRTHRSMMPPSFDQVVLDGLDEARVRLGVGVGVLGELELAGLVVGDPVALRRAVDAVGPVQPGVEPLRAVGRAHLVRQHVRQLVVERLRRPSAVEVAVLSPQCRQQPARRWITCLAALLGPGADIVVGSRVESADGHRSRRPSSADARLAEVLGDHDVGRELRPGLGHLRVGHLEDDRAVGLEILLDRVVHLTVSNGSWPAW